MFTLTFRRHSITGCTETVVEAQKYVKNERRNDKDSPITSCLVIVYEKLYSETGVEHFVYDGNCACGTGYDVCFITNQKGKTIDRIGPFRNSENAKTGVAA